MVGPAVPELPGGRADSRCCVVVSVETADLAVAQAVVDEREEMTGGGDAADVAAAAVTDAGLDRSDRGSRTCRRPLRPPPSAATVTLVYRGPGRSTGSGACCHGRRAALGTNEGGQGRAVGPPVGAALTARSVAAGTIKLGEARQGLP